MSEFDHFDDPRPKRGGLRVVVFRTMWMAASLGALVFVVMQAYELGSSGGPVPELNAEGPYRTAPSQETGRVFAGRDLTVYEGVEAGDDASRSIAEDPVRPTPEDLAAAQARLTGQETLNLIAEAYDLDPDKIRRKIVSLETLETEPGAVETLGDEAAAFAPVPITPAPQRDEPQAVESVVAGDVDPIETASVEAGDSVVLGAQAAPLEPVEVQSVELSPVVDDVAEVREVNEADDAPEAPAQADQAANVVEDTNPPEPVAALGGGLGARFEAQLAALGSREAVSREWEKLRKTHSDLLGAYSLRVEPATIDGQRLFRLRLTPFVDRQQAAELCRALAERDVACFVAASG